MTLPRATYRLQFRDGMTFDRAVEIVPYLARLGISHLYASPIFTAPKGSTHGYDVADHNEIDPAIGGREGFDRLSAVLKKAGLGLILDIVPNHMAASLENPWWRNVVEWGEQSPYARHFDINWRERLTLPILGRAFEEAAKQGEIGLRLQPAKGVLGLSYFETVLPLHPSTYREALAGDPLGERIAEEAEQAQPEDAEAMHGRIGALLADEAAATRLQTLLDARARDAAFLRRLHDGQPWRLLFWKEARKHLSYRRFFEVTGLAGVRVEDEAVFQDVHRLTLELVRSGQVDGLRIDHVDGLGDPAAYLTRLREAVGPDVFIVVEKILGENEPLAAEWPIAGTTGYEFAALQPELFVDEKGLAQLTRRHVAMVGQEFDVEEERRAAKRLMVSDNFETELKGLARIAAQLSDGADEAALRNAITDLIVAFPVYRSYGTSAGMGERDARLLDKVAATARKARGSADDAPLSSVLRLLLDGGEGAAEFRTRFQQLTGPATAKSVEDTLFYRANRMIALNEVGGDPAQEVGSVARFHAAMAERVNTQPHGLLATATHDTKRGEDARARLYAPSERPDQWADAVGRWREMNANGVRHLPDGPAPEPDTEWLLFQALAGMWPVTADPADAETLAGLADRFEAYVEKALREAKRRTSWSEHGEAYEDAVKAYARRLLDPDNKAFLADFASVLRPFIEAGQRNSLAQTLIKLTAPGIPDIYQGTEGWDLSLVDPDNRRPVDFAVLSARLDALEEGVFPPDFESAKLFLIATGLRLRKEDPALFADGAYLPLQARGTNAEGVVAFMRSDGAGAVMTVVSRLGLKSGQASGEDAEILLPPEARGRWENRLTGERLEAGERLDARDVLQGRPVALLRRA